MLFAPAGVAKRRRDSADSGTTSTPNSSNAEERFAPFSGDCPCPMMTLGRRLRMIATARASLKAIIVLPHAQSCNRKKISPDAPVYSRRHAGERGSQVDLSVARSMHWHQESCSTILCRGVTEYRKKIPGEPRHTSSGFKNTGGTVTLRCRPPPKHFSIEPAPCASSPSSRAARTARTR